MAKEKKRFFVKRTEDGSEHLELKTKSFRLKLTFFKFPRLQFPQNFRLITASVLSQVFWTVLYSCITFWVCIIFIPLIPHPPHISLFSDALIDSPFSYRAHILFLESLAHRNRLDEAQHELAFLYLMKNTAPASSADISQIAALESAIAEKKNVFTKTVENYAYWSATTSSHPYYRDGLYSLAQRSYMLFDDVQTKKLLEETIALDPQFEQGKKVLELLSN